MAEARFSLPDGRTGTLRGASMQELARKAREMGATLEAPQEAAGSAAQAVTNATGARVLNAMSNAAEGALNAPARILEGLMAASGGMGSTPLAVPGSPAAAMGGVRFPRVSLPDGQTLAAAIESPMQAVLAGQSLGDAFDARVADRRQIAADRPGATMAGEVATDVASMMAGRRPFRGPQTGGAFDRHISRAVDGLAARLGKNGTSFAADVVGSGASRAVARGLGRVGETALEGAALGALQGGDPAELAATGAGMQAAASAGNQLREIMVGPPGQFSVKRAAASIAAGTVALGLLAESVPFDADDPLGPLRWLEANFEKAATGALLGFTVGLAGRRGSTGPRTLGHYFPDAADALSTAPRAAILELVRESQQDETVARAMLNVPALGTADAKRFMQIVEGDEPAKELRAWMESNPRVGRILSAPDTRLADVPVKEEI